MVGLKVKVSLKPPGIRSEHDIYQAKSCQEFLLWIQESHEQSGQHNVADMANIVMQTAQIT